MSQEINDLVEALLCLPSVGPRSAQRMAYHLLLGNRQKGLLLAGRLSKAMNNIAHCQYCNNFSSDDICNICSSKARNTTQLCIVEMPLDLQAIEKSGGFSGQYFVLMGHLSPIDGIGPQQLSIDLLIERCQLVGFKEVIFAINPSVEGEATIYYIKEQLKRFDISISQLARGVPMGGELEFLDSSTIDKALSMRSVISDAIPI